MPYTQQHMLLQWEASWNLNGNPNGQQFEIATGAIRFAGPGLDDADTDQSLYGMAQVLGRYWNQIGAQIPGNCFLNHIKWNKIDVNGHYVDQNNTRETTIPPQGGAGATQYPTQVAWATTWATDARRGLAARGRTFWPTSRTFDGNNMKVTQANCLVKAALDASLIYQLNAAARNGYVEAPPSNYAEWAQLVGWSPTDVREGSGVSAMVMSKVGAGRSLVITNAEVGDRLDIQRRRANQMSDIRTISPVEPTNP